MFLFILVALFPSADAGFTITMLHLIPWSIYRICVTSLMDWGHNYSYTIKTLTDGTWPFFFLNNELQYKNYFKAHHNLAGQNSPVI